MCSGNYSTASRRSRRREGEEEEGGGRKRRRRGSECISFIKVVPLLPLV